MQWCLDINLKRLISAVLGFYSLKSLLVNENKNKVYAGGERILSVSINKLVGGHGR